MKIIKLFRELKETVKEFYDSIVLLKEQILVHKEELEKIKEVLSKKEGLLTSSSGHTTLVNGPIATEDMVVTMLDSTLLKDYFTKEFINKEATTTKEIYVVDGCNITKEYYKDSKDINEADARFYKYDGKEYRFVG